MTSARDEYFATLKAAMEGRLEKEAVFAAFNSLDDQDKVAVASFFNDYYLDIPVFHHLGTLQ